MPAAAAPTQQMSPDQANMLARQAILSASIDMTQPIAGITINPAQVNPILIQPRYVGLLKKFIITVTGSIVNSDGALDLTLTDIGLANLFDQIIWTDLNNNQRVQTTGWHLSFINSIKQHKPSYSGYALETDTMGGYGEVYGVLSAPATIAHGTTGTFRAVFEVPIAYGPRDLRGAIWMNVVNATAQLSLHVNQAPFVAAGVNSTLAMYKGTVNAVISSLTINVYQNYLDQLPVGKNGVILPLKDISTIYELKNTQLTSIAANTDNPFQYPNFRDILSTSMIYNHDTSADAGRTAGTDINYFALQSANFTNLWKLFPLDLAAKTREILNTDLPKGAYYSSSRTKPISSIQYGNIEIVINPNAAAASAIMLIGLEDFSYPNTIQNAGSLQG